MIQPKEHPSMEKVTVSDRGKHLRYNFSHSSEVSIHDSLEDSLDFNDLILGELTRPQYKYSPSAPHGEHIPLTQQEYAIKNQLHSSKSYNGRKWEDPDEGLGVSVSTQRSYEGERRRRSYKESGYGGSSGKGSGDTSGSDDVFDTPVDSRLTRTISIQPTLNPVHETCESHTTSSGETDKSHLSSIINKEELINSQTEVTPDLEKLNPRSVSGFEVSVSEGADESPNSHVPSFRQLGINSVVTPPSNDVPTRFNFLTPRQVNDPSDDQSEGVEAGDDSSSISTLKDDDVDFYSLPPDQDHVLHSPVLFSSQSQSLMEPTHVSLFRTKASEKQDKYIPNRALRLPSIDIDASYKTELQLQSIYGRCLSLHRNQELLKVLTSEERPEVIYSLIQRFHSESDFSSIGGARSSLGSISSLLYRKISEEESENTIQSNPLAEYEKEEWKKLYSVKESTLLSQLTKYSSCRQKGCQEADCIIGRGLLRYMEEFLDSKIESLAPENIVLKALSNHAGCCDELKCQLPWCTFFTENSVTFEEQIARLQHYYFSGTVGINLAPTEEDIYISLNNKQNIGIKEGEDWIGMARLGHYSNVILAVTNDVERPSFIVVKRERNDSLWHGDVLSLLRPHPRLTKHHWLLQQEQSTFIAAAFEGSSLADRLNDSSDASLSLAHTLNYLDQLASAATFLHKCRIAYLNWTLENVLLSACQKLVKLCNFSCSVPLDNMDDEEKIEDLKLMLPARIIPPELYVDDIVGVESDVWGFACTTYQMLTGSMIYPEYRHVDPSLLRDQFMDAGNLKEPDLSSLAKHPHVYNIAWNCFKIDPAARPDLNDVRKEIIAAKTSSIQ